VVKADAYGHGVLGVSKTLINNGADMLAVAFIDEALQLRAGGYDVPIMLLGYTSADYAQTLIENDITTTVFDYDMAREFSRVACMLNKKMKIHIKIDTGMSRIGFISSDKDSERRILDIARLPMLDVEGIFTHLSVADCADAEYTNMQFERFMNLCKSLEGEGLYIPVKHICNSAATIRHRGLHLDMVRVGLALYGLNPLDTQEIKLVPAMELKSKIVQIKELPMNTFVGYGNTFKTEKKTRIATISIGYADGYFRCLSNKAIAGVNGQTARIAGNVCMDQLMLDVTGIDADIGDYVTLFGGDTSVTTDYIAKLAGTISYEIVCAISKRVPRLYKKDGRIIERVSYLQ